MTKEKIRKNIPSLDYTQLINKELPLIYIERTFRVLEKIGQNLGYRQKKLQRLSNKHQANWI
jgi:hypothetical protein